MFILLVMAVTMIRQFSSMAMPMPTMAVPLSTSVAVTMFVKQKKTDQVDSKTYVKYEQDWLRPVS